MKIFLRRNDYRCCDYNSGRKISAWMFRRWRKFLDKFFISVSESVCETFSFVRFYILAQRLLLHHAMSRVCEWWLHRKGPLSLQGKRKLLYCTEISLSSCICSLWHLGKMLFFYKNVLHWNHIFVRLLYAYWNF